MHKYVIRRVLLAIPVLILSSLIVFGLIHVIRRTGVIPIRGLSLWMDGQSFAALREFSPALGPQDAGAHVLGASWLLPAVAE